MRTKKIEDTSEMFYDCRFLININLNGLNTSKLINMNNMFNGLRTIESLDLSSLDTLKVTDMRFICSNVFFKNIRYK